ncbi:MAG: hypothetical protein V2J07_10090 [Anaerolineae bacterium]|jgi:hypothetical protein|nr:hypothetical protein [Anaerolineae bacterium]
MTELVITINEIITAGIAITAFGLLLYSLAFNLRNRVSISFSLVMVCVVIINSADAIASNSENALMIELLLWAQWFGIIWLPAAMSRFAKALLSTTGVTFRPNYYLSTFFVSGAFTVLLFTNILLGQITINDAPAPHFTRNIWNVLFLFYYSIVIVISLNNIYRARRRARTTTTRRRTSYLLFSSLALGIGSFPYLIYGSEVATSIPGFFWMTALVFNIFTGIFIVIMAYSVAFFGVSQPDRVVKNRLVRWLFRGPITAIATLVIVTIVRRIGENFGTPYSAFVPISMLLSVLLLEYLITLFGHQWERKLFFEDNHKDVQLLETLQERLFTEADMQQLLETILASIRDLTRTNVAFVTTAQIKNGDTKIIAKSGEIDEKQQHRYFSEITELFHHEQDQHIEMERFTLIPLHSESPFIVEEKQEPVSEPALIGFLGLEKFNFDDLTDDQAENFSYLEERILLALENHIAQERVFSSLNALSPDLERLQQMRAQSRFSPTLVQQSENVTSETAKWVKDALTHFWGGPKLTNNPLNEFKIVVASISSEENSNANALRNILREAIQQMKPAGEVQYTNEWLLYNILDLKYLRGMKVREIARQLSLSEADFYRKQRVAINELARIILLMEENAV